MYLPWDTNDKNLTNITPVKTQFLKTDKSFKIKPLLIIVGGRGLLPIQSNKNITQTPWQITLALSLYNT